MDLSITSQILFKTVSSLCFLTCTPGYDLAQAEGFDQGPQWGVGQPPDYCVAQHQAGPVGNHIVNIDHPQRVNQPVRSKLGAFNHQPRHEPGQSNLPPRPVRPPKVAVHPQWPGQQNIGQKFRVDVDERVEVIRHHVKIRQGLVRIWQDQPDRGKDQPGHHH